MSLTTNKWLKPTLTLLTIGAIAWASPTEPIDPWNLLNIKKICTLIFGLVLIQIIGSAMSNRLGSRMGAIFTGFFGGLVSSTATTASLARKSITDDTNDHSSEILVFLSASLAMLFEAAALVLVGKTDLHYSILLVFGGPILTAIAMIYCYSRKTVKNINQSIETPFEILPILMLSLFIVSILLLSKLLQSFFGKYGLIALTFLISLFEIHSSVIANVQLHEIGSVDAKLLISLLAVSIAASYMSKLFLVSTIASAKLKHRVFKSTGLLFASLLLAWAIALILNL